MNMNCCLCAHCTLRLKLTLFSRMDLAQCLAWEGYRPVGNLHMFAGPRGPEQGEWGIPKYMAQRLYMMD